MKAYLKWAYWYKNFGDEILLFGVINWIIQNHDIEELVVEVWELDWIQRRIEKNKEAGFITKNLDKTTFVSIKQHKYRILTHLQNIFWFGKYRSYFKFFGGWQVLDDSRSFPHDGWNLALLYNYTIRKGNFALLWWIWSINRSRTKLLYNYLLHKAKQIVVREDFSFDIAKHILWENDHKLKLYHDFSLDLINSLKIAKQEKNDKYIIINLSIHALHNDSHEKIKQYCGQHKGYNKIFFYCDYDDDKNYFTSLEKEIPDLEMYDWTKHTIQESLELMNNSEWWIWARLHFLYPLKLFGKKYISLTHSDKIRNVLK